MLPPPLSLSSSLESEDDESDASGRRSPPTLPLKYSEPEEILRAWVEFEDEGAAVVARVSFLKGLGPGAWTGGGGRVDVSETIRDGGREALDTRREVLAAGVAGMRLFESKGSAARVLNDGDQRRHERVGLRKSSPCRKMRSMPSVCTVLPSAA